MKPSVVAAVAVLLGCALALPSEATTPPLPRARPLVVTDLAGDANGVNTQGGLLPPTVNVASPASAKDGDILSFRLGRLDNGRAVTALTGTLTLAAPPSAGHDYRITMSAPGCSLYYLEFEYLADAGPLSPQGEVRHTCGAKGTPGSATFAVVPTVVRGNSIIWTLPIRALPGGVRLGQQLTVTGAQSSLESAVIGPGLDEVVVDKRFRIGQ